ncbi:MAG: hypothetical protein ABI895_26985 [Deltaproteobacteria bacterium]
MRHPLLLACLLSCTPPTPALTASPDNTPLTLAPGQAAELSVGADGRATARLTTATGSERFVVILASTRFDSVTDAPPTRYTLSSPGPAEALSPQRVLDGCAFSSERFSTTALPTDPAPTGPAPTEGATRTLYVPTGTTTESIQARALSVGEHAVIWADTSHPTTLDQAFVLQFRDDFERVILPRARQVFGTEPDLDHDGRIQLVFSRLTRERGVAFFSSCDLNEQLDGCHDSNHGEYLYLTPPDAIDPPYNTPNAIKEILAHEVAHLLHFQRKVLRNHLSTWQDPVYLSEGIGALAQDVTGYQAGNLYVTRAGLDGIDQFSLADLLRRSDDAPEHSKEGVLRGGGYLFVRYLYDRAGGDAAAGLEIENRGGPTLLRALLDAPVWIDQALPRVVSADLADLALDFYTALALSNRDQAGDARATNPCFQYLPTLVDPITQKQRGADLFARFHGSQMQGPKLGSAQAPDGQLLPGGVDYLSLDATAGSPDLRLAVQLDPQSAPRIRIARWK